MSYSSIVGNATQLLLLSTIVMYLKGILEDARGYVGGY